jgi:paraquat-inducible protein B
MTTAKPEVTRGKKLTAIWIIPLVAVVLGIWMVIYSFMTEGPEIEITFKTATGLEAGKTKVKFRNIELGMLQEITLSEDLESVVALVKLEREALPLLREDTRFWVVRAHIGGKGVSGLDTLLSGAYIEFAPGNSKTKSKKFIGLEQPPLTPVGAHGLRLILLSDSATSLSSGDSVLYHGFNVGRLESVIFDHETRKFRNIIFIDAPYHTLVDSAVRFWDVSGISVSIDAKGVEVSTGSLDTLLRGGIAFGTPPGANPGNPVENETEFQLFASYDAVLNAPFVHRSYYVVAFKQSLKGLLPGAPVEYRGIRVGTVERILARELFTRQMREPLKFEGAAIPVLIYVEPAAAFMPDSTDSLEIVTEIIQTGIKKGLRATLNTASLLTGAQYVALDFFVDESLAEQGEFAGYTTIPTVATGLGQLEHKISVLLDKVNRLPLDRIVNSTNQALAELDRTLAALRALLDDESTRAVPAELEASLASLRVLLDDESTRAIPGELEASLAALRVILDDDSARALLGEMEATLAAARVQLQGETPEIHQLSLTLREVGNAARALRQFLEFLEQNPESLLQGKRR